MNSPTAVVQGLNGWDFLIIIFYALLVSAIGPICRKLNRNPSDYFRGGGKMLWWVGAVSAMATGISTWFTLPMGLFWGGIGLNPLGVFMSSVFRIDLSVTIVVVGILVTFLAVIGGQWAISFFAVVQGVILLLMLILGAFFSMSRPEIGGVAGFLPALPERHLNFNAETSTALVWLWISWQLIFRTLDTLDLRNSGKFLRVKDDSSTRKMVLMMVVPRFLLGLPILTQVPSMCAAVVFPDIQSVFPQLSNPNEGAWLAMALTVLPHGLIGLMVCTMFGAAADSADAALNSNAGFFVRNVYLRYIRPEASARNQILMGKAVTASFGLLTIIIGLMVNSLPSLNLFDLMQLLNAMLLTPMTVPMVLGLIIKKIPDWSGWSTVVAGLVAASLSMTFYTPALAQSLLGIGRELTPRESIDSQFLVVSLATASVSTLWFLATLAFLGHSKPVHRERIESLFSDLARPADHLAEGGENQDAMQYRIIGLLSQVMGGFLLLCMTIPNPWWGRLSFLLIGGTLFLMGAAFFRTYRRLSKATAHLPDQP